MFCKYAKPRAGVAEFLSDGEKISVTTKRNRQSERQQKFESKENPTDNICDHKVHPSKLLVSMGGLGHGYFSAEKFRDPASLPERSGLQVPGAMHVHTHLVLLGEYGGT